MLHQRLHLKTIGILQLTHHAAACLLTCASKGSPYAVLHSPCFQCTSGCKSRWHSLISKAVNGLTFTAWRASSWCRRMKLIISVISCEGNPGLSLEPASVKSGCTAEPISFSLEGSWRKGRMDAYLWILNYRICDLTDAGKHFTARYFHLSKCVAMSMLYLHIFLLQ